MALYKEIRQEDGVMTTYHRICYLNIATNKLNSIAVLSYTDQKATLNVSVGMFAPYHKSITYTAPYDQNMTIESAYNYLKTLPDFEGAEDI